MSAPDEFDDDLEFERCGNIGCDEGWVADCFDGLCVNAENGCEMCLRRCDWCNALAKNTDSPPPMGRNDA